MGTNSSLDYGKEISMDELNKFKKDCGILKHEWTGWSNISFNGRFNVQQKKCIKCNRIKERIL